MSRVQTRDQARSKGYNSVVRFISPSVLLRKATPELAAQWDAFYMSDAVDTFDNNAFSFYYGTGRSLQHFRLARNQLFKT